MAAGWPGVGRASFTLRYHYVSPEQEGEMGGEGSEEMLQLRIFNLGEEKKKPRNTANNWKQEGEVAQSSKLAATFYRKIKRRFLGPLPSDYTHIPGPTPNQTVLSKTNREDVHGPRGHHCNNRN